MQRPKPSALLVDLHRPVVDGLEFLRRVRSVAHLADVPVAVMTGHSLVDDRVTGALQSLGVPLYFKPLWEEDLVAIVERLLCSRAQGNSPGRGEKLPCLPTAADGIPSI
jgi:DNA-binding response OmpR family regulator